MLKGNIEKIEKSLVAVDTTYHSSTSHLTPTIDDRQYIYFLRRINPNHEGLEKDVDYYELVKGWHGMIALEKEAKSQRAVNRIKEVYGIDVNKDPQNFIDAIEFLINGKKTDKQISKEALDLYNRIKAVDAPQIGCH
jgi:hypothetical protein